MYAFFIVLFMISLAALIVGMIKPAFIKFPTRKRVVAIFLPAFFIFLILALASPTPSAQETNQSVSTQPEVNTNSNPSEPKTEIITINATKLVSDYEANTVAADSKYKDQIIEITGVIEDIGKDILDTPYVVLTGGQSILDDVQCMFDKSDATQEELSILKKSQTLTVRGWVRGQTLGNVLVNNCFIPASQ